jgi:HEAT repeat protein/uncharacterized protein YegL
VTAAAFAPLVLALAPLLPQEAAPVDARELAQRVEAAIERGAPAAELVTLLVRLGAVRDARAAEELAGFALELDGFPARRAVMALAGCDQPHSGRELRELAKRADHPAARDEALRRLAASGEEEDLEWLRKRWSREDDEAARRLILQQLVQREAPGLERLVLEAAEDRDPTLRAQGLRGIGQLGLARALPRVKRELGDGNVGVRRAAVEALGGIGGREAFIALVEVATDSRFTALQGEVDRALHSADDADEVNVLVRALSTRDEVLAQRLLEAVAAAAPAQPQLCGKALFRGLANPDEAVRSAAVRGLVRARIRGAAEALAKRVDHRNLATRTDAVWGLSRLGDIPSHRHAAIVHLAGHAEDALRRHATSALRWVGSEEALATAGVALQDEHWPVVSAAVESLLAMRRPESLSWLIEAGAARQDRLRGDIADALELLTGEAFGPNFAAWRRWLADQPADLRLPDPEVAARLVERARAARAASPQETTTYHGIPVPPGPVVFVLDHSGSMASRRGGRKVSDLRHFADALEQVLRGLPQSQRFNLVLFGSGVRTWQPAPVEATTDNVDAACQLLAATTPTGGTNLYDALEEAVLMEGVQTVFVLTDGQPSAGRRVAAGDILLGIEYANRDLGIRIHTIAAGSVAADFLQQLAETNGGEAVDLRRAGGR